MQNKATTPPSNEEVELLFSGHITWFVKEIESYTSFIRKNGEKEQRHINRRLFYIVKKLIETAKIHYSRRQQKKIIQAIRYAAIKHQGVYRKDGITPYILHPLEVALFIIKDDIFNFKILVAAILHDVPEDTTKTAEECIIALREIGKLFGSGVKNIVSLVTVPPDSLEKTSFISFMKKGADTFFDEEHDAIMNTVVIAPSKRAKKEFYWLRIKKEEDLTIRWMAIVLKIEDRKHNIKTLGVMSEEKRNYKIEETRKEFPPLFTVLEKTLLRLYQKGTIKDSNKLILSRRLKLSLDHETQKHK